MLRDLRLVKVFGQYPLSSYHLAYGATGATPRAMIGSTRTKCPGSNPSPEQNPGRWAVRGGLGRLYYLPEPQSHNDLLCHHKQF